MFCNVPKYVATSICFLLSYLIFIYCKSLIYNPVILFSHSKMVYLMILYLPLPWFHHYCHRLLLSALFYFPFHAASFPPTLLVAWQVPQNSGKFLIFVLRDVPFVEMQMQWPAWNHWKRRLSKDRAIWPPSFRNLLELGGRGQWRMRALKLQIKSTLSGR